MLIKMLQLEDTRPGVYCSFVYGSVLVHLSERDKYVSHLSDKYIEVTITYLPSFTVLAQKSYSQGKTQNFHDKSSSYDIEGLLWVLKIVWLWTPLHKIIDLFLKKLPRFLKIEVILCKKRDSFHSFCILFMAFEDIKKSYLKYCLNLLPRRKWSTRISIYFLLNL